MLKRIQFIILLIIVILNYVNLHGNHGSKKDKKTHSHYNHHKHREEKENYNNRISEIINFSHYKNKFQDFLNENLSPLTKIHQAYVGATITSSAPIPIFLIMIIFNIRNIKILDIMSSFAAGALLGDVMLHNLPEITENENGNSNNFFTNKYTMICIGVLVLFVLEKIIRYYSESSMSKNNDKQVNDHKDSDHGHSHGGMNLTESSVQSSHNVVMTLIGDFVHNLTDGLAIGAAFSTRITATISIFLHEIPHEVGDFSYLLKQKLTFSKALTSQIITSFGSFLGVYLNSLIGEKYSTEILSFASGAFLYLSINTILGDLKKPHSLLNIMVEAVSFVLGLYLLFNLV